MSKYFAFLLLFVFASTQGLPRASRRLPPPGRIVGGVEADRKDYPYIATIQWKGYYSFCGASFLGVVDDASWFMTACHCIQYDKAEELSLVIQNKTTDSPTGQRLQVSSIIINPLWDPYTMEYDICMLKCKDKPQDDQLLSQISLCDYEDIETDKMVEVMGWGATAESGSSSSSLQVVQVPIVDNDVCNSAYGSQGWSVFSSSMICAGYPEGGKDSCQGDSGGPIVACKASGEGKCLIGVVSWGLGCARPEYPGVYGYAVSMADWILETMGGTPGSTTTTTTSTTTEESTTTRTTTTSTERPTSTSTTTVAPTTTNRATSTTTKVPTTQETMTPFETTTTTTTTEGHSSTSPPSGHHKEKTLWDTDRTAVVVCLICIGILALSIPMAIAVALTKQLDRNHAVAIALPLAVTILLCMTLGLSWVLN